MSPCAGPLPASSRSCWLMSVHASCWKSCSAEADVQFHPPDVVMDKLATSSDTRLMKATRAR
ncbi:MAG: hypothetical protein MZW92_66160 [Comamonadaceae bacterium]|nr:hypothetical protein [Comamonadaceae bacterium]